MHRTSPEQTALIGVGAGGAALAAGEFVAAVLPDGRSPLSGLGRALIDLMPGPAVDITVATAETMDKPLLKATLTGQWLTAGAVAALLTERDRPGELVLLFQGVLAGAAAATRPQASSRSSVAAGTIGGAVGAALLARTRRRRKAPTQLLEATTLAVALGGLARTVRRRQEQRLEARRRAVSLPPAARPVPPPLPSTRFDVPGLTPLFTPPGDFYVTDVAFPAPRVDRATWRLRIHGLVERPLKFTLEDLLSMELVELDATLACVHNPVGGPRIGTARWLGVPVADLLDRAGVRPGAQQLVAHSVDGFSAGVPIEQITDGAHALIALGLNGEALPVANGFPARLLIPGLWGADANTKWLDSLELTTWAAVHDYWDARGWPRRPTAVKPGSRIDVPRHRTQLSAGAITVAGVAWAPPAGVNHVEISIDGEAWQRTEITDELAPTAWRQWRYEWHAAPGEHHLRVRTLGRAAIQPETPAPPYPEGSSGYHAIRIRVHHELRRQTRPRRQAHRLTDAIADGRRRLALASMAPPAWLRHGFPRAPDFPGPDAS